MKSQLYKCWFNGDDCEPEEYVAQSPELAAEYFCEDEVEDYNEPEVLVDVEAEDGTVYTVTVEVKVKPSFRAKS